MRISRISIAVQSLFYIAGGINHFWHERSYVQIMPHHYSHPGALVEVSGLAEILGGAGLLVPATRRVSAIGLTCMLVVFLDVHQDMLRHTERYPGIPRWVLWARIPLQFVLMAWALYYARKIEPTEHSDTLDSQGL